MLAEQVLVGRHAHHRLVLAAVRDSRRRARSGAGSRRSGSGPGAGSGAATARRSPGRPAAGSRGRRPSLRTRRLNSGAARLRFAPPPGPAEAGAEEAGGAVALGQQLQEARVAARGEAAMRRRRDRRPRRPRGVLGRGDRRRSSFSRRRDRAGRVDQRAARAQRPRRADQQPALERGEALDVGRRLAPAGVGARGERPEVGAGRVQEDPIVARAEVGLGRVGDRSRRTQSAPARAQSASISAARRGSASIETISPRSPIRAAIAVVLIPGPAQRSSTRSPGCGSSSATTACEPRDCGTSSPVAIRAPTGSAARSTTSPSAGSSSPPEPGPRDLDPVAPQVGRDPSRAPRAACSPASPSRRARSSPPSPAAPRRRRAPTTTSPPATRDRSARSRRRPGSSRRARRAARRARPPPGAGARSRTRLRRGRGRAAPPERRIPCFASSTAWSTAAWSAVSENSSS